MQSNRQMGRSASSAWLGLYGCVSRKTTELPWAVSHRLPSPLCRPCPASCRRSRLRSSRGTTHTPHSGISPSTSQQALKRVQASQNSPATEMEAARDKTRPSAKQYYKASGLSRKEQPGFVITQETGQQLSPNGNPHPSLGPREQVRAPRTAWAMFVSPSSSVNM